MKLFNWFKKNNDITLETKLAEALKDLNYYQEQDRLKFYEIERLRDGENFDLKRLRGEVNRYEMEVITLKDLIQEKNMVIDQLLKKEEN